MQELAETRGGELRIGRLRWAGPTTGMLILAAAYESGEQLAAVEAAREAPTDRPLESLMESGALQIVTGALMTRIDL